MRREPLLIVIILLGMILFAFRVIAPPTPHSISGTIFHSNGATEVSLGTAYSLNNTNSSEYIRGKTSQPGAHPGRYAETIQANDGDYIRINAWNASHYGETNVTIIGNMNKIDVIINITRPSELNVTIRIPANGTRYNASANFTVNITVMNIGGSTGTGCYLTFQSKNLNIFNISEGENVTRTIGTLTKWQTINTSFNVTAKRLGNSSITIAGSCLSDGINLEKADVQTKTNITVVDTMPPIVTLLEPANNSINASSGEITFFYQVNENDALRNCSLFINSAFDQVNTTVIGIGNRSNFTKSLGNGNYLWFVQCFDYLNNSGTSEIWNISIAIYVPRVTEISINDPHYLEEGIAKTIFCNATVADDSGADDLVKVNATFYHNTSTAQSLDDNNLHYTNASCENTSTIGNTKTFACGFSVWYYANPGNWTCNATVMDLSNNTNSSRKNSTISELYGLSSGLMIDFGFVSAGSISADDANITLANFGNRPINISVKGYGVTDGDNLSMICTAGSIPKENEHYNAIKGNSFADMYNLSNQTTLIQNLTFPQRVNDATFDNDRNFSFWKISVPAGVIGSCNGTVVFSLLPI